MLAANETKTHEIRIPGNIVPGSLTASVAVYPTPLASMTAAMERLIQEPYGCFEQTSSTTYPLVMAQQYFTTHTGVDPATTAEVLRRAVTAAPPGVFVDFDAEADRYGRSGIGYRELRPEHEITWTVLADDATTLEGRNFLSASSIIGT